MSGDEPRETETDQLLWAFEGHVNDRGDSPKVLVWGKDIIIQYDTN